MNISCVISIHKQWRFLFAVVNIWRGSKTFIKVILEHYPSLS